MIGEKLGSFRIKETLGAGAMGAVYLAIHEPTGKVAALKIIGSDIAQRNNTSRRFDREADILKQFDHPNIVRWLGVGRFQGTSYLAMEYVQGGTLEQLLTERSALPWREVVDLGIQMCSALHYAHQRGVVHRDIKPSNLMITAQGAVKLTDFGIAKDLDATGLTATGRTLGTAAYMAPEQIRGTPAVSHKTDLYALGVLFYQMLTGRTPFEGATAVVLMHCHLNEPPPRPSGKTAEIPKALDDLVVKLMAKAPADRPWDAEAVGFALTELRDKASKAEAVPMVWPTIDADGNVVTPAAATPRAPTQGAKKTRKAARTLGTREFGGTRAGRRAIETVGLVLALIVVAGAIAYVVWPPGQDYLYRHAKELMASSNRVDWIIARDEYIEPLNQRFPNHPYRDEARGWLDAILLRDAEARAARLDSPVRTTLTEPNTPIEHQYVATARRSAVLTSKKDDLGIVRVWQDFARQLHPDDKDERGWYLLAQKRLTDLGQAIQTREKFVRGEVERAQAKFDAGSFEEANAIRRNIRDEYGAYTSLETVLPAELKPPADGEADDKSPKDAKKAKPSEDAIERKQ
ncbi:MAG: serine/threonine-protein kinase [Isosphaeraceae bacterium]|nr:serine/threonine-protein kinase [Isosphaeraceae bacterium]